MGQNYILTERFEWYSLRVIWTGPRSGSIISATLIGSEIATRTALLWNVRCSQTSVVVRVVTCSISKVWGVGLPMRNPHAMVERCNQGRSTIDLWAGIFGNRVIGLVYLPTPIKCATYSQLWHIVNSVSLIFSSATQSLVFAAVKWLRAGQTPLHRRGWELLKLLQFLSERTVKSRSIVSLRLSILTMKRKICCAKKRI